MKYVKANAKKVNAGKELSLQDLINERSECIDMFDSIAPYIRPELSKHVDMLTKYINNIKQAEQLNAKRN